jgi:hypothetical protein
VGNIFAKLAKELSEVRRQTNGVRQLTEHAMASRLLALFFGWDWYQHKISFREDPDEWTHNLKGDTSINRVIYHKRVVQLGDAVFTLLKRESKGGDLLKQRFHTRPTKPCFVETQIASLLAYNGFEVEIVGETGIRGEDFDLAVTRDTVTLNIEITAKEDGRPLTVQTISNTVQSKRTQVPQHRPAILYMRIPAEWKATLRESHAIFNEAFADFFQRSHRFNAIILVWEDVMPFMSGAFTQITMWGCYNNNPRHPYPHMNLLEPMASPDGQVLLAHSFLDWLEGLEAKNEVLE